MWAAAHGALEDLLLDEFPATAPRPQKDAFQIFQGLATFYLKYLRIFRSLEAVYDQLVHPQKRRVVRHVLDGVMGRLLELRNEMVELEMSEFHYFDDVLQDLKMTPEDLEIPIPRYFLREKMHVLKERQRMLAHILAKGGLIEQEPVREITMHLEEAVRILQVCERARQGRLRAQFMKEIRQAEREGLGKRRPPSALNPEQAATRIQKVETAMVHDPKRNTPTFWLPAESSKPSAAHLRAQRVEAHRQLVQEQNESEYQQALLSVKKSVQVAEGPDIRETLQEQIRQWFLECRDATGKFPDFPSTEDGGSASIFAEKTPEQVLSTSASRTYVWISYGQLSNPALSCST
uniref:IQ motif containing with AAA domain 1 n=1 Tax=Myripristis murdjan TaxID=586833 RepID=A0A668AT82_9TELE